jgi:hypothetical protein
VETPLCRTEHRQARGFIHATFSIEKIYRGILMNKFALYHKYMDNTRSVSKPEAHTSRLQSYVKEYK